MIDEIQEQDLLKRAVRGERGAFEDLVKAHQSSVRAFFRVRLFDWAAADDLAQDVFVTAFQRIGTFRRDSRFSAWLRGIATNHLRNYLRKRREEPVGGSEEIQRLIHDHINLQYDQQFVGRDPSLPEGLLLEALESCLGRLDGSARDLVERRYVASRSIRQLAEETNKGYSALTMQFVRIRKSLAECIRRKLRSPA